MTTRHLLDPELTAAIDALPQLPLDRATLPALRAMVAQTRGLLLAAMPTYPTIAVTEQRAPGPPGAPPVRVLVYRPRAATVPMPALLWIHGGGYVVGDPEADDWEVKKIVDAVGCCVVSVDYRLAPEAPHPGPVEDCHAALAWLHREAEALGVDRQRIAIAGLSAGGGLCAALALLARDRGEVPICFQAPMQPMLDDRTAAAKAPNPTVGEFVWTPTSNHFGWSALLGHEPGIDGVSPYAAAARATDLAGLPPTFIGVGAMDLFLEEDVEFARRLVRAGVPTELHVYPGACHGFNVLVPAAQVSQAYQHDFLAALRRAFAAGGAAAAAADPNAAKVAALVMQLPQGLPGIPLQDVPRFAASLASREPYALGPESLPQPGVPAGTLQAARCAPGAVYPDVPHDYTVYRPAQLDPTRPASLIVFLDGARYLGPEVNAATVLDNLIHAGALPPTVAVFVNPGPNGPGLPIYGGSDHRSVEYDSLGDAYARFLLDELLPEATRGLAISTDPARRAVCGLSSSGLAAFNVAWERPDAFGNVITHCGSFVDIRGGHAIIPAVRRHPRKPLRVFQQTGRHDLDIVFGHWLNANRDLAAALDYHGYPHRLEVGEGGHSLVHGGAILPDTLRWIFAGDAA